MKKNRSIEFYRFLLCIPILMMHIGSSTALNGSKFNKGGYAVECFFVLSGFLLARSLDYWQVEGNPLKDSLKKTWRQMAKIMPYYFVCLWTTFAYKIYVYYKYYDLTAEKWAQFINNFFAESFFLTGVSYRSFHINGPDWYISALLIATFILTFILLELKKNCKKSWQRKLMVLIGLYILVYFIRPGFFAKIELISRAIANMGVGICAYILFSVVEAKAKNVSTYVWDGIEVVSLILIGVCFLPNLQLNSKYIAFPFAILVIVQFMQKSHLTKMLENNVSAFLGRMSLPIYLGQMLVISKYAFLPGYDITVHRKLAYFTIALVVFLWAVVIDWTIVWFKNRVKKKEAGYALEAKKVLFLVSILLFAKSFATEQIFFDMNHINRVVYVCCKVLLLCCYIVIPQLIYKVVRKKENRKWVALFGIILGVYIVFLLLSWPGKWNNDEFYILGTIRQFGILYHQSFFTSIFFILSLMTIPSCGSIILFQEVICAAIATYIIKKLYKKCGKYAYCLVVIFLSPVTIYYVLYPLRAGMYTFTFALLIIEIMRIIAHDRVESKDLIRIGILTAVVAAWRSESSFLVIVIAIIIYCTIIKNKQAKRYMLILLAAMMIPFAVFSRVNSLRDEKTSQIAMLYSFMTGTSVMLQEGELRSDDLEKDLQNINAVLNVEKMKENASATDLWKIYDAVSPLDFSTEEYKKCIKSIEKLIIFNPEKYIDAKWDMFKNSTGMSNEFWLSLPVSKEDAYAIVEMYGGAPDVLKVYNPINDKCRETTILFLTGQYTIDDGNRMVWKDIWTLYIPIFILPVSMMILLIRKKVRYALLDMTVILDCALVYLTAPETNPMYYFPFYIIGWVVIIYQVSMWGEKERGIENE